jgi:hypothetical protein
MALEYTFYTKKPASKYGHRKGDNNSFIAKRLIFKPVPESEFYSFFPLLCTELTALMSIRTD